MPEDRARSRHFSGQRPQARHGEQGVEHETFRTIEAIGQVAQESGESMGTLAQVWLLAQPMVATVLTGARNAGQVERNLRAAEVTAKPETLQRLTELTDPLKKTLGDNPDMWQSASRVF